MAIARDIGSYKKENNITILQSARWQHILEKYKAKAKAHDLSDDFITRFIKAVHDESIDQQEKVFGQ